MRQISVCIPIYNRYQYVIDVFKDVIHDDRIHEFVLCDDCSTDDSYELLQQYFHHNQKVKFYRNEINIDCYANKRQSVKHAESEWVCVWDSDNIFHTDYIDTLYAIPEWDKKTFYLPEFARPHFSATKWSGLTVTKENVAKYTEEHLMTNLNAFNLFINREQYLKIFDGSTNPITSDSIFFSLCWLESGHKIYVTPNLQYDHRVGHSSHYNQNQHRTVEFHKEVMKRLKALK